MRTFLIVISMNKIMFNDRFNLTKLVFGGRKTQTRRLELDCNTRFIFITMRVHIRKSRIIGFVFIPMTVISLPLKILGIKSEKRSP